MRSLRLLVLVCAWVATGTSWAQFPASNAQYAWSAQATSGVQSPEALCVPPGVVRTDPPLAAGAIARCVSSGFTIGQIFVVQGSASCPANSTLNGATCTCNSGWTVNATNNGCVRPCEAGSVSNQGMYNVGTSPKGHPPPVACASGCEVVYYGTGATARQLVDGVYNYFGMGYYERTGEQCQSGDTRPSSFPTLPPPTCGPGNYQGQVNGVDVCLTPTGKTPNPHGSSETKTTGVTHEDLPGGGTRTIEVSANGDGSTTTTTTERDAQGRVTGVSVVREGGNPLEGFCNENPSNPLCSKSVWGGTCAAGHTCEGDAATCAIARAAWEARCDAIATGPVTDLGAAILGGNDPADLPDPNNPTEVGIGAFDLSGFGLGRACLADQQISVPAFGSFVIPWSVVCGPLQSAGLLLIAGALLGAVRIVGVRN